MTPKIDLDAPSESETRKLVPGASVCARPFWRCVAALFALAAFAALVLTVRFYLRVVLVWLEGQHEAVKIASIVALFVAVSFPITVGYIVIVCFSGYVYGFALGLPLAVLGANCGALVAHHALRHLRHHALVYRTTETPTAHAIKKLIAGPRGFRIVMFARLTPIPFGLQNTIFALSNVRPGIYHLASLIGLFPTQVLAVYLGSTVRSMQDIWEHKNMSSGAYVIIVFQLVLDASMLVWVAYKARKELIKALAEAESSNYTSEV